MQAMAINFGTGEPLTAYAVEPPAVAAATDQAASESTVVDLGELEELAKAALASWAHNKNSWYQEGTLQSTIDDDDDGAFMAAASPAAVLALIQELRARREREATGGWIACADDMPEVGAEVIFRGARWSSIEYGVLTSDDHGRPDGWEVRTMSDEDTGYYLSDITHWMPLPKPPVAP